MVHPPVESLWAAWFADPSRVTRNALVEHYTPFVRRVVASVLRRSGAETARREDHHRVLVEDLESAALEELFGLVDRFEPGPATFESFAYPRLLGAVKDELRRGSRYTRGETGAYMAVQEAHGRLAQRLGRQPSVDELAAATGLSVRAVEAALPEFDRGEIGDSHAVAGDPAAHLEMVEMRAMVDTAMRALSERHQMVLGALWVMDLTQTDLAEFLGCSVALISEERNAAVAALRRELRRVAVSGRHLVAA